MRDQPPPFPENSRLLAYCRDSGGRDQDVSVDRQRAELLAWAADHGFTIARWFEDRARSGGSTQRRDAFLELTDYLSEPHRPEAGVVIWEYARFARQFDDAMFYVASIRRTGYTVYSVTDAIPDTLEGRLLESILAWKNAKYREDLSRAVRSGLKLVASAFHGYPGNRVPLGFRKQYIDIGKRRDGTPHRTATLIPDPQTAPLIQSAFELRAGGATYAEIHRRIHLTEHPTSLRKILRNPVYSGTLVFGGNDYPGFCPPLVSTETFARAQAVNGLRAKKFGVHHPRRVRSRFLLTGLLFCSHCDSRLDSHVGKRAGRPDRLYYICHTSRVDKSACRARMIPKDQIEQLVLDTVGEHLQHPDLFQQMLKRSGKMKTRNSPPRNLVRLQAELAQTDTELRHILDAVHAAGHSKALLDDLAALEAKRDELAARIDSARVSVPPPQHLNPDELRHTLALLKQKLRSDDPAESLTVLRGLVAEIKISRGDETSAYQRGTPLTGEITLLLPLSGEPLVVPLVG